MKKRIYTQNLEKFFKQGGTVEEMLEDSELKKQYYDLVELMMGSLGDDSIIEILRPIFTVHHTLSNEYPRQLSLVDILQGSPIGDRLAKKSLTQNQRETLQTWDFLGFTVSLKETVTNQFFFMRLNSVG
jgi:hypothetical protein